MEFVRHRRIEPRGGLVPLFARCFGGPRIALARLDQSLIQLSDPLASSLDRRELLAHLLAQSGERVRLDPVFPGKGANVEQARFTSSRRAGSNAKASAA